MLTPSENWQTFRSAEEKLAWSRKWGLVPEKADWIRRLRYSGCFSEGPVNCTLVGSDGGDTAVILLPDGSLHAITGEYLAELQNGAYAEPWPESYVAFDLETTGLSPARDRIIEIGAIRVSDGAADETFHTYVDPDRPIPPEIAALTGITDEDVAAAPAPHQAVQQFLDFCDDLPLVAHNARFDISFTEAAAGRKLKNKSFDTLKLARKAWPGLPHYSLTELCRFLHIDTGTAHRSMADTEAARRLFVRCLLQLNGHS